MITTSPTVGEIQKALAVAQGAFGPIMKDRKAKIHSQRTGRDFEYSYVDLAATLEVVRPHLTGNGLSLVQDIEQQAAGVNVLTRLMHASGEWMQFGPLFMACDTTDARNIGIAITYARRYHVTAALGVAAEEDTDAAGAGQAKPAAAPPRQTDKATGEVTEPGAEDLCPEHGTPWKHVVGDYKEGHDKYPGHYDFYACPEKDCKKRPPKGYGTAKAAESGEPEKPSPALLGLVKQTWADNGKTAAKDQQYHWQAWCIQTGNLGLKGPSEATAQQVEAYLATFGPPADAPEADPGPWEDLTDPASPA